MGNENEIAVDIVARNKTAEGLNQATDSVKGAAGEMSGALGESTTAAKETVGAIESLSGALKSHQEENRGAARSARFFTNELMEITGKGNESAEAIGRLAGGLATGGVFGISMAAALISVKLLKEAFSFLGHEAEVTANNIANMARLSAQIAKDVEAEKKITQEMADANRLWGKTSEEITLIKANEKIARFENARAADHRNPHLQ